MTPGRVLRNGTVAVLALLWLVPTWLLVVNALVPAKSYTGGPHWLPQDFGLFDNMSQAWDKAHLGPALGNSLMYAVVSALAAALLASCAAFATIVMPVKRQVIWFWIIYTGTLLPLQVFIRPLFLAYAHTSLYDTQFGLVLIYTAIAVPFTFFVMRNYALTLPREVVEAARMDGASWWRLFWQIHVPLTRSAMIA